MYLRLRLVLLYSYSHVSLDVRSRAFGALVATAGLGELLCVVPLTTAPHDDPSVLHGL
jgi:hypothetical protein